MRNGSVLSRRVEAGKGRLEIVLRLILLKAIKFSSAVQGPYALSEISVFMGKVGEKKLSFYCR